MLHDPFKFNSKKKLTKKIRVFLKNTLYLLRYDDLISKSNSISSNREKVLKEVEAIYRNVNNLCHAIENKKVNLKMTKVDFEDNILRRIEAE
jgi:hypothetical protein